MREGNWSSASHTWDWIHNLIWLQDEAPTDSHWPRQYSVILSVRLFLDSVSMSFCWNGCVSACISVWVMWTAPHLYWPRRGGCSYQWGCAPRSHSETQADSNSPSFLVSLVSPAQSPGGRRAWTWTPLGSRGPGLGLGWSCSLCSGKNLVTSSHPPTRRLQTVDGLFPQSRKSMLEPAGRVCCIASITRDLP